MITAGSLCRYLHVPNHKACVTNTFRRSIPRDQIVGGTPQCCCNTIEQASVLTLSLMPAEPPTPPSPEIIAETEGGHLKYARITVVAITAALLIRICSGQINHTFSLAAVRRCIQDSPYKHDATSRASPSAATHASFVSRWVLGTHMRLAA